MLPARTYRDVTLTQKNWRHSPKAKLGGEKEAAKTSVDRTARVDGPFISPNDVYVSPEGIAYISKGLVALHDLTAAGVLSGVKEQKSARKSVPPTSGSAKCWYPGGRGEANAVSGQAP